MESDLSSIHSESSTDSQQTWIQWFCQIPGHEFLIELPPDYFQDPQNLIHLESQVTINESFVLPTEQACSLKEAVAMILGAAPESLDDAHAIRVY